MEALLALIQSGGYFITASRRLRLWTDVPQSEQPAVFIAERNDVVTRQSESMPSKTTLGVDLFIYTAASNPDDVPATKLNKAIEAIEAVLAPTRADLVRNRQTLGGLVSHCYVDGEIFKEPGDLDGQGLAIIPLRILVP